jgi:ABC-2 type transport system permease protein
MKKFKFLVKFGLLKRIGRKSFLVANIVIAILTIGIINLPTIIRLFSGDDQPKVINIQIINEINQDTLATDLSLLINPAEGEPLFNISFIEPTSFDVETFWTHKEVDIVFHFAGTLEASNIQIYSKKPETSQALQPVVEYLLISYQIENYIPPQFATETPDDYESPEQQMGLSSVVTILVLPMFILITIATQFIGVDIIEEKSTKAIETIIASVPARIHFLSKISAAISFVVIQGALVIIYGAIGSLVGGASASLGGVNLPAGEESLMAYLAEILPNWPVVLGLSLLFMIVGTLFYLVVAALFASMAVTQEDYQQFQSPLMITLVLAFYIGIFSPMLGANGFMKVMSFIPLFTPIVAPIALASGVLSIGEAVLALLLVGLFLVGSLYFVAPIYKVAILSYDQTKFFKRIKGYFKKGLQKNGNHPHKK